MRYCIFCLVFIFSFLEVAAQQLPKNIEFTTDKLQFEVSFFDGSLKVYRGQFTDLNQLVHQSGILGKTTSDSLLVIFKPLVPFDIETPYTLVYQEQLFEFQIVSDDASRKLQVTSVYPSTNEVPANILKWYIRFSKPVNPVKIYDHIQFLDDENQPIDRSILKLGAPLLSPDGMLLTVWIEPGRQKRDLGPNQHLGSVFEPSSRYTLLIDNTLKDATGLAIDHSYNHTFSTLQSDRVKPSIGDFVAGSIKAKTQLPLIVKCAEHLDYGSLIDAFSIYHNDQLVSGETHFDYQLATIIFVPDVNWKIGKYTLIFESQLEDLAGNNLNQLFDRPVEEDAGTLAQKSYSLEVVCF